MNAKRSIVFVDDPPLFSGGQKMLVHYLAAVEGLGDRILIRSADGPENDSAWPAEKIYRIAFPKFPCGMSRLSTQIRMLPRAFLAACRIGRIIAKERPAAVVVNSYYALIEMWLLRLVFRFPLAFVVHTSDVPVNRAGMRLLGVCDMLIGVCGAVLDRLPSRAGGLRKIVRNAVPAVGPGKTAVLPEDSFNVVFAGRLIADKHVAELVDAVLQLRSEGLGVRLFILGDGPERAVLEGVVRRAGAGDFIRFLGWLDDSFSVISAADAVCLPSRLEGSPLCLLEALAAGVPVVATMVGGVPEILKEGENGFALATPDVCEIKSGIRKAMNWKRHERKVGIQKSFCERFDVETQKKAFRSALSELIGLQERV